MHWDTRKKAGMSLIAPIYFSAFALFAAVSIVTFSADSATVDAAVDAVVRHVALAGEPELAVVLLVVDHVHEVREHLAAVTTDEYVRTACKRKRSFLLQ